MDHRGLLYGILFLIVLAGLVLWTYYTRVTPEERPGRRPGLERKFNRPIVLRERIPGAGRDWSRRAYPADYEPANTAESLFAPLRLGEWDEERFLDVANRAYSRECLERADYHAPDDAGPRVAVEYLQRAEAFTGVLRAEGLKPNFAYQLKLRGRYADDPEAFRRIGYVGRWRLPGKGTNYDDEDFEDYPDKDRAEAYLLFDYFVTDGAGRAVKPFYVDSSLHVLWNATHQRAPNPEDSAQTVVDRRDTDPVRYAHPYPKLGLQRLYAESEQHNRHRDNRPAIGEAFLPPGACNAELVLTEESFHGYGDAGYWATVMAAPVRFDILDRPKFPVESGPFNLAGEPLPLDRAELVNLLPSARDAERVEGIAETGDPQVIFDAPIECAGDERYVLALELLAAGKHTWSLYLDLGEGFERRPVNSYSTTGWRGWQRFEIEVTSLVAGRAVRLRIDPAEREGAVGLRNVGLFRVLE